MRPRDLVRLFRALASEHRLAILALLAREPLRPAELSDCLAKLSLEKGYYNHVAELQKAGLVESRRVSRGPGVSYHLSAQEDPDLDALLRAIIKLSRFELPPSPKRSEPEKPPEPFYFASVTEGGGKPKWYDLGQGRAKAEEAFYALCEGITPAGEIALYDRPPDTHGNPGGQALVKWRRNGAKPARRDEE
jgi:DNA-binding transcriptional ArsR family regulator